MSIFHQISPKSPNFSKKTKVVSSSAPAEHPEDVPKGPGDDAPFVLGVGRAHHGVGLPGARLAVGEDGAVVAVHDT